MAATPNFKDLELPDVVGKFSLEPSGLIVFAGDGESTRAAAYALAEHTGSTTGRKVATITSGRGNVPRAIREEAAACEAPVILVDARMNTDALREVVKAAGQGAAVIAAMKSDGAHGYVHLIDLIWAAEDWDGGFRRDFEAALYAVVTQTLVDTDNGKVLETDLHLGNKKGTTP